MHIRETRDALLSRIGRLSQVGGITPFRYADGKAAGTETLRMRTASGLELWVVPDRGMDIYEASFRGRSLCWHSPTGMVHPSYYSSRGAEWLKSFAGGLLTTCGLSTAGPPSEESGESLGLHGSIANSPAEALSWSEKWQGDDCVFTISGKVREAAVHGPNLVLERTISTSLHSSSVVIKDTVENQGFRESPLMVLYHLNFGFPLLTERSRIHAPSKGVEPINEISAHSQERWDRFEPAVMGQQERVYFHRMAKGADGRVSVVLVDDAEKPEFGVRLSYDPTTLPEFIEWKMTGVNHFVLGLEPANCRLGGRARERERGAVEMLAPGERRSFELELTVLDGGEQVAEAIRSTQ